MAENKIVLNTNLTDKKKETLKKMWKTINTPLVKTGRIEHEDDFVDEAVMVETKHGWW